MKILYHHRTGSKDGQAVHIEELTAALRKLGHELIIVGPAMTARQDFGRQSGLVATLKRHLPGALYELLELSYALIAYIRLERAYRRTRPDVLYERSSLFMPAGVWLKRRYRLPMLLEVNAPLFAERREVGGLALERLARWSEALTWRAADYVLPVTRVLAEHIKQAGVPDARIVVISNAIDPARFLRDVDREAAQRRLGLTGRLVLGFTGFMREWHRLDQVVELLAELDPGLGAHLLLVGDGPVRAALEAQARDLGVGQRVTFTGVIERDAMADVVAAFDIALQPAVRPYASPLKLFEYMALGCAVVAPRTPNIEEVLADGDSAVLFDPIRAGALKGAVERVCRDAALRARIGAAAREAITDRGFTWEQNARRVESLVRRLR
jgi:glycosyltransferase involved in cell wall biosynthesis